ncbi:MAG TPA: hypothetical protein VFU38_07905 [Candidatus Krumholzibacteria bacterium]|nr:hypothetical protein [Candidatus Krumholzibacteria bacterium]
MVAKNDALTFEELRDDCWPAMFEQPSDDDIRWLRNVADLLRRRASERDEPPPPDGAASPN